MKISRHELPKMTRTNDVNVVTSIRTPAWAELVATFFGAGRMKPGPGTGIGRHAFGLGVDCLASSLFLSNSGGNPLKRVRDCGRNPRGHGGSSVGVAEGSPVGRDR